MLMAVELGKVNLAEQASDERMGQVALKGFFAIARHWKLKPGEQRTLLGDLPATTFNRYKQLPQVALNRDLMERISYILGIHKALRILFQDADRAYDWMHLPNDAFPFGGQTALEFVLQGSLVRLAELRAYLDAMRG